MITCEFIGVGKIELNDDTVAHTRYIRFLSSEEFAIIKALREVIFTEVTVENDRTEIRKALIRLGIYT